MSDLAKIAACRAAQMALFPIAALAWAVVVMHENIANGQKRLERRAGLGHEWNAWRERERRAEGIR